MGKSVGGKPPEVSRVFSNDFLLNSAHMEFLATGTAGQSEHNKFLINIEQSERDLTAVRSTIANDKFIDLNVPLNLDFWIFELSNYFFSSISNFISQYLISHFP